MGCNQHYRRWSLELAIGLCVLVPTNAAVFAQGGASSQFMRGVPDTCLGQGETEISVELWMVNVASPGVTGFQVFLEYDATKLTFEPTLSSYDNTIFAQHFTPMTAAELNPGELNLDGAKAFGSSGSTGDELLATLTFSVNSWAECDPETVDFRAFGPFESTLSYQGVPVAGPPANLIVTPEITQDVTLPSVSVDVVGGAVDAACEREVSFTGTITDLCCMDENAVSVSVSLTPATVGNATLETAIYDVTQISPTEVSVSGTVLVHDLTDCPATVEVSISATDCCGNPSVLGTATGDVFDDTPPQLADCPDSEITAECDDIPAPAAVSATDNCDVTVTPTLVETDSTLVNNSNLAGWTFHTTNSSGTLGTGVTGAAELVNGPTTPPIGAGSARLTTGSNGSGSAQLRNGDWAGTRLDALTTLKYSTYASAWNGQQLPYLTIWIDHTGDGVRDDRLWFEPDFSSPTANMSNPNPQAEAMLNTWQTWDCLIGMWYSDNEAGPGSNTISLAAYLALHPDATIINDAAQSTGGIRIASGFASVANSFDANVDAFMIGTAAGTVIYNFELGNCTGHSLLRTWTATDDCGNASTCEQLINVVDTTPPVFSECPTDDTASCETVPPPAVVTASDACGGSAAVSFDEWINAPLLTRGAFISSPAGWGFQTQSTARGNLVSGPDVPPAGIGSFGMITGPGSGSGGKVWLATANYNGLPLADITNLSYSTYVSPSSGAASHIAAAINIYVDLDADGDRDTTLVFEPVYVVGTQGPVMQGVWQTWDTLNGNGWWYTAAFGTLASPAGEYKPLSHYLVQYPNAKITAWNADPRGVQLVAGQNGLGAPFANFDGAVDNFFIETADFTDINDFEPGADIRICNGAIERSWSTSDDCGNENTCDQTITVQDVTPPVITCPDNVVVNADAAECTAVVNTGTATATDNCGTPVTISWVREDGALSLSDPFSSSFVGLEVTPGVTRVTWTAVDACGNISTCNQKITILAVNELTNFAIELDGVSVPSSRCIRFNGTPGTCQDTDTTVVLNFVDHDGMPGTRVRAIVPSPANPSPIVLPCGNYTSVCMKDEQRTLISSLPLTVVGTSYSGSGALVTLLGGDTDNDSDVDINDVTFFIARFALSDPAYTCGAYSVASHRGSDFSGNGNVGGEDFTFLSDNWLAFTSCACGGPFIGTPDDTDLTDIVIAPETGIGRVNGKAFLMASEIEPAVRPLVDLNRDGRFDYRDVEVFENARGLPRRLSSKMKAALAADPQGLPVDGDVMQTGEAQSIEVKGAATKRR